MVRDLGYRRIQVEIDNISVVQLIKENNANVNDLSTIIKMIKELMRIGVIKLITFTVK